jgi:hypothetical protein
MMTSNDEKEISFLPFHAINEFMNSEYRLSVIRSALSSLPTLPVEFRAPIDYLTKKIVKVPGFRNSLKAPVPLKIRPFAEAFEKNPELVAAILSAWSESHSELRQQIFDFLKSRNWDILPVEADRTKLPGFLTVWPKDEDFEILSTAFKEIHPEGNASTDDISLMVVWLSNRLPYHFEGEEEEKASDYDSSES